MLTPPWRSLITGALHRHRSLPQSRFFQLATVTEEGLPANRTVVFRGFYLDTNIIQIITDSRSEKIAQIQRQPKAEACWYFEKTREQFRLGGDLSLILAEEKDVNQQLHRTQAWKNLSDNARNQFSWPAPKQPKTTDETLFKIENVDQEKPTDNFCLMLLNVKNVDHLQLKGDPQNRCIYTLDEQGKWQSFQVNP